MLSTKLPPTYLAPFVSADSIPVSYDIEWRGKIQSSTRGSQFRIKYYGELFTTDFKGRLVSKNGLIAGTDFAPALVYAVDIHSGEEILLFDGCRHGYNALFCDAYTAAQLNDRPLSNWYKDDSGLDVFSIEVKVYHNMDYEDEFADEIAEKGGLETINGNIITVDTIKRDGFDYFELIATNANGKQLVVITEELA
jgi:hypothetical protein